MKLKTSLAMAAIAIFSVSCASKDKKSDTDTKAQTKQEQVKSADTKIAAEDSKSNALAYSCQVLNDKRMITFEREEKRCEVHYTKFGEKNQVAWAQATPSICDDVFARIRKNIEEKGFNCTTLNDKSSNEKRETASR